MNQVGGGRLCDLYTPHLAISARKILPLQTQRSHQAQEARDVFGRMSPYSKRQIGCCQFFC